MFVLDTDIITLVQRADSEEYSRFVIRSQPFLAQPMCVTIVSFEEQTRGWLAIISRAKTLNQLIDAYTRLHGHLKEFQKRPVLDFDSQSATIFQRLKESRIRIGTSDLKIASITLANNATLLSRNLRDFRKVPDLRIEDWTTLNR